MWQSSFRAAIILGTLLTATPGIECLAIREKTQPDRWTTFNPGAPGLLLAGYEWMKQCEKTTPTHGTVRSLDAIGRLVQPYEALGKKDDAARWRRELELLKSANKRPVQP